MNTMLALLIQHLAFLVLGLIVLGLLPGKVKRRNGGLFKCSLVGIGFTAMAIFCLYMDYRGWK